MAGAGEVPAECVKEVQGKLGLVMPRKFCLVKINKHKLSVLEYDRE